MQGNRNRYFDGIQRSRQRGTEKTNLGVRKVADFVELSSAVKPAVGQAGQEQSEDDKARSPLVRRQRAVGIHSFPKVKQCRERGNRELNLSPGKTLQHIKFVGPQIFTGRIAHPLSSIHQNMPTLNGEVLNLLENLVGVPPG